jgi:hypothetical protein
MTVTTVIPGGKATVTPYVVTKGAAKFLDFVETTFGTGQAMRVPNEDGTIGTPRCSLATRLSWPSTLYLIGRTPRASSVST